MNKVIEKDLNKWKNKIVDISYNDILKIDTKWRSKRVDKSIKKSHTDMGSTKTLTLGKSEHKTAKI